MSILTEVVQRCEDVKSLAEGGQKKVLAARHPEFGQVVIKYGEYRFAAGLERIAREVALLREIESPYYPRQYEFIVEPVAREFLVIEERLDAKELGEVRDKFTSDDQILELLRHLVYALRVIWQRNVVHRDLKPANILITPSGEPRIIDLGIARFLDHVTLTAGPVGPATPIYAAPEQLLNRKAMINVRTDFFLLGILTLELMNGFHPFDPQHVGSQKSLVENIVDGTYVRPDPIRDQRLRGFAERVLHVQPFKRFRTVESVFNQLGMDFDADLPPVRS